jgi:hypothetical protein
MTYAWRASPNADWIELAGPGPFAVAGRDVPGGWVEGLDAEERDALGFAEVVETAAPTGVRVLGSHLADDAGVPTRAWDTEAYDGAAIAAQQAACARTIEAEAGRRIEAILPTSRQLWNIAAVLDRIVTYGADPTGWPQEDQDALPAIQAAWGSIQGVGNAALAIEATIPADAAGIAELQAGVADHPDWP